MTEVGIVRRFTGKYAFLGPWYSCPVVIYPSWAPEGVAAISAEHAYQALKAKDRETGQLILGAETPSLACEIGGKISARLGWEKERVEMMMQVLCGKFSPDGVLGHRLIDTGNVFLEFGNSWGETYWGVHRGEGMNLLGHLIMNRRRVLSLLSEHRTRRNVFLAKGVPVPGSDFDGSCVCYGDVAGPYCYSCFNWGEKAQEGGNVPSGEEGAGSWKKGSFRHLNRHQEATFKSGNSKVVDWGEKGLIDLVDERLRERENEG